MTDFEITKLVLGGLAFLLTWTGMVVGATRMVEKIKADVSDKMAAEALARSDDLDGLRKEVGDTQKIQDHNIGEMGLSLRRHIETVEKQMHEIEIWGRDNYVQKNEFEKALASLERSTESIRSDIKALVADIKSEFKEMRSEITTKH